MEPVNYENSSSTPIRADKTIAWLMESRDHWKQKCLQAKLQLKRKTLALKRVRDGRNQLKTLINSLKMQNRKLELMVQIQKDLISELKKKQL